MSIDQILYYYSIDAFWDGYVRSVMSYYSGVIAVDHFPLGVGFGAFGSWFSGVFYSPIYFDYGIYDVYGITPENYHYIADFYWAMVLGQFGGVGLVLLLMTYFLLFRGLYFLGMSVPAGLNQKDVDRIKLLVFSALLVLIALLIDSTGDSILTQSRGVWAFYYISLVVSQLASLGKNRALKYE